MYVKKLLEKKSVSFVIYSIGSTLSNYQENNLVTSNNIILVSFFLLPALDIIQIQTRNNSVKRISI